MEEARKERSSSICGSQLELLSYTSITGKATLQPGPSHNLDLYAYNSRLCTSICYLAFLVLWCYIIDDIPFTKPAHNFHATYMHQPTQAHAQTVQCAHYMHAPTQTRACCACYIRAIHHPNPHILCMLRHAPTTQSRALILRYVHVT